jgi:hypothetical protein
MVMMRPSSIWTVDPWLRGIRPTLFWQHIRLLAIGLTQKGLPSTQIAPRIVLFVFRSEAL